MVGIKAAADLGESINAVNVIFGEGARNILKFGENSAKAVGMATAEFNQMATVTGALLKDVGIPMNEVADMTNELALRAADMASVMNTDVKDAMAAIQQAMRGEAEAIRRYGGDVTQASLQQYALAEGITTAVTAMTEQEKRLLRVGLLMKQTEMFAGDFADTSGEFTNQVRILRAELTNMAASMGEELIPTVNKLVTVIRKGVDLFTSLSPEVRKAIVVAGALTAGLAAILLILPLVINGFVALKAAVIAAKIAVIAFHATALWPITLALIGLSLQVAAAIIIWKLFGDSIKTIMKSAAQSVVDTINNIIKNLNSLIGAVNKIAGLFGKEIPKIPPLVLDVGAAFDAAGEKIDKFKTAAMDKINSVKGLIMDTKKEAESLFDEFEFDEPDFVGPVKQTAAEVLAAMGGPEGQARKSALFTQVYLADQLEAMGLGQMASDIISGAAFDGLGTTIVEVNNMLRDAITDGTKQVVAAVEATVPEIVDPLKAINAAREEAKNRGIGAWIEEEFRGSNKTLGQVGVMAEIMTAEGRARLAARQLANTTWTDAEGNLLTGDPEKGGVIAPQPGSVMAAPVVNVFIDGKDLASHVEANLGPDAADEEQVKGGA